MKFSRVAFLAAILALSSTFGAWGAEVAILGAEKPVGANSFADLSVKINPGDMVTWKVFPNPIKKKTYANGEFALAGVPGTKYTVFATVLNWGDEKGFGKRFDEGQVEVSFEGEAPPTPTPPGPNPPGPAPNPPGPTPDPAPISEPGLRVLIVYNETDFNKMKPGQGAIIWGKASHAWLDQNCVQDGKRKGWRIWDKNVDASGATETWKKAFDRTKTKNTPWVLISNGKTGYEGPLPETQEEFIELVEKYKTN